MVFTFREGKVSLLCLTDLGYFCVVCSLVFLFHSTVVNWPFTDVLSLFIRQQRRKGRFTKVLSDEMVSSSDRDPAQDSGQEEEVPS